MKAVIMAGGEGRRLKAVSGELPKPMVPLLGRPMLEHITALLKKHGFTDICMAVKYHAQDIIDHFGDGSRFGLNITYSVEKEALGTAGAVKNCESFWRGEDFLVISGDAACDMDLGELCREHKKDNAAATLALCRSAEPLSYGLALTDTEGAIRCFIEKPGWPQVVTDLVNTGIYMLSPQAMELVPEGMAFDFAKDLFPLLLERGEKLRGLSLDGYWCDVGSPLSYYRCCVDALEGRLDIEPSPAFARGVSQCQSGESHMEECDESLVCSCKNRAALMGALSGAMLDMGADYSDGLRLEGRGYTLHIAPLADSAAVRVAVRSADAEFARSLAFSASELIAALDL